MVLAEQFKYSIMILVFFIPCKCNVGPVMKPVLYGQSAVVQMNLLGTTLFP